MTSSTYEHQQALEALISRLEQAQADSNKRLTGIRAAHKVFTWKHALFTTFFLVLLYALIEFTSYPLLAWPLLSVVIIIGGTITAAETFRGKPIFDATSLHQDATTEEVLTARKKSIRRMSSKLASVILLTMISAVIFTNVWFTSITTVSPLGTLLLYGILFIPAIYGISAWHLVWITLNQEKKEKKLLDELIAEINTMREQAKQTNPF